MKPQAAEAEGAAAVQGAGKAQSLHDGGKVSRRSLVEKLGSRRFESNSHFVVQH
jgi:hypothetical protein